VYVQRTLQHTALAMAHLDLGDPELAEADLKKALEFAERNGEHSWEGWARLVWGELALYRGDRATAAQHFDEAQEIAEGLGMRPLLERCRAALARVA
jgi:tetratricopeptide (TPR) repeat protein